MILKADLFKVFAQMGWLVEQDVKNNGVRCHKSLFLLDYAVALLFPRISKLVIVIYRLKNRSIRQLPFKSASANGVNFFLVNIR